MGADEHGHRSACHGAAAGADSRGHCEGVLVRRVAVRWTIARRDSSYVLRHGTVPEQHVTVGQQERYGSVFLGSVAGTWMWCGTLLAR